MKTSLLLITLSAMLTVVRPAAGLDANLQRLVAQRLVETRRATPSLATATGVTIACAALTARETRARGAHVFACASSAGEVLGALLSPKGVVRCSVTGVIDFGVLCGTVAVCGVAQDFCL